MEYRGFLIVADRADDCFNIFDSDGDIIDVGLASSDQAKDVIDLVCLVYGL